jgi:hypothetical protein
MSFQALKAAFLAPDSLAVCEEVLLWSQVERNDVPFWFLSLSTQ